MTRFVGDDGTMVTTNVLKRSRLKYLGVNYHDDCGFGSGTSKNKSVEKFKSVIADFKWPGYGYSVY